MSRHPPVENETLAWRDSQLAASRRAILAEIALALDNDGATQAMEIATPFSLEDLACMIDRVETMQKSAIAGCPIPITVSVPAVPMVAVAEAAGITLGGMARAAGFETFTHTGRPPVEAFRKRRAAGQVSNHAT
jgi:formate dehydrogenase assembly factor FdhD